MSTLEKVILKQYINLSPAFYGKDSELRELQSKFSGSFIAVQEQYKNLKKQTQQDYINFFKQNLQDQRKQIELDGNSIIQAFFEVIEKINHDRVLMSCAIPTLDGIIFG